jgi:transcriptional regulator with XRE-family HTH domain
MMTHLRKLLASNIRIYRNMLGLSQAKLAEKADTATNYIASIEAGRRFPSDEMLERIAAALEIDSPELFSIAPQHIDSVTKLHEDILRDIQQRVSDCITERLTDLRHQRIDNGDTGAEKSSSDSLDWE